MFEGIENQVREGESITIRRGKRGSIVVIRERNSKLNCRELIVYKENKAVLACLYSISKEIENCWDEYRDCTDEYEKISGKTYSDIDELITNGIEIKISAQPRNLELVVKKDDEEDIKIVGQTVDALMYFLEKEASKVYSC